MSIETTAFDPVSGEPLPPTASHAARILSRFISGKPELSDKSLSTYTSIIRECMDNHSFTLDDWNATLGLEPGNPLGNVVLRTLESRVSDNDAVLESSKTLETQLREKFGAEGRGLHEYTSNVESALPENLVKTLRWIATRRNGIVHGDGDGFQDTQQRAMYVLQAARSWDWLRNASYESPVNDEQRAAASSYEKSEMDEEKIKRNDKIFMAAVIVTVAAIVAIVGSYMFGPVRGIIAGILAGGVVTPVNTAKQRQRIIKQEKS
jgi:hypothetical protein